MKASNLKRHLTYAVSFLFPRNKNKWCFGAWMGEKFADNPRALLDYMVEHHPEFSYTWVMKDPAGADTAAYPNVRFVRRGSFAAWKAAAGSKYIVMSHGATDISDLNWMGGAVRIHTQHGVAIKKIGIDSLRPAGPSLRSRLKYRNGVSAHRMERGGRWYVTPSDAYGRTLCSAYGATPEKLIHAGFPRNGLLHDRERMSQLREKFCRENGIDPEKKLVLYMPTFRGKGAEIFSFSDHVAEIPENVVVIERSHFADRARQVKGAAGRLIDGSSGDAQELLAAADVLISDYSSAQCDFLITGRPLIQFLYDYDRYRDQDRGLYYTLEEMDCGHVAMTQEELFGMLREIADGTFVADEKQEMLRERMVTYEGPDSCAKICEAVLGKK